MMRQLFIILFVLLAAVDSFPATSVVKNGITWTFAADYTVGQFVTGDYYVVDPGSGITITSVSPAQTSTTNGTQVNPTVDGSQCFDSRANYWNATLRPTFPLTVHGGDAVISTISVGDSAATATDWAGGSIDSHTFVWGAEILTVLSAAPPAGSFRPGYTDRSQHLYASSSVNLGILPALSIPSGASLPHPLSYYERGMDRPWLMFLYNYTSRSIHAVQNMYEYHREISTFFSEFAVIMMTNTTGMQPAINRLIQIGIDAYYIGQQGVGDSAYYVLPTLYAGLLLGDSEMTNFFTGTTLRAKPRDYPDFYYWADHQSTLTSGVVPVGQTWTGHTVFFRNQVGDGEHEHLHPSEWNQTTYDHWKNEAYRRGIDSYTQVGMALSARLMGNNAMTLWNHPATFDYIDRWMGEDWAAECAVTALYTENAGIYPITCSTAFPPRSNSTFIDAMWDTYRGATAPPQVCSNNIIYCKTQSDCESNGHVWCGEYCQDTACEIVTEPSGYLQVLNDGTVHINSSGSAKITQ